MSNPFPSPSQLRSIGAVALPDEALALLTRVDAPPRLVAHLALVHDAARRLCDGVEARWPGARFDRMAVLFGAATHDIGKATVRSELSAPGRLHEEVGRTMLRGAGISAEFARFAVTHGATGNMTTLAIEDLLVIVADHVWKAKRVSAFEERLAAVIAVEGGVGFWDVLPALLDQLDAVSEGADARVQFQRGFPVDSCSSTRDRSVGNLDVAE